MKKEVVVGLLFIFLTLILLSSLQAQTTLVNETAKIDKAYACLGSKTNTTAKCSSLSTEEKTFSLLAISQCKNELMSDSQNNGECWPSGNCRIKTTAQAILALDNSNQQTSTAQDWLLSQNKSPTELIWYLQVENPDGATDCTVSYGASSYEFSIGEDKKIWNNSTGPCLSRAQDDYWFRISPSCYNQEFQISCNKDFSTTLLFSKTGTATIHVLPNTHSAASGSGSQGTTTEKVESYCFAENNFCTYEGTLWAALVLNALDKDVSSYLPYLITLAEDNPRFLPDAFLFFITSDENFGASLLSKQRSNKWWSESGDRYYDTALAMYPFQSETRTEKTNAKQWLLEVQDANGCWQDNTRNTAFILASIWPRGTSGDGVDGELPSCTSKGYYCVSSGSCDGQVFSEYDCPTLFECCSAQSQQPTCDELGGEICSSSEICSGSTASVSGLSTGQICCTTGTCKARGEDQGTSFTCETSGGTCRISSCESNETLSTDYTCQYDDKCCVSESKPKSSYTWIWILLVLIVLVVAGILFRDKLRNLWFKMKSKGGKPGAAGPGYRGPPAPPYTPYYPRPTRPFPERRILVPSQQPQRPALRPVKSAASKELDDVLKKLKEMGK